MKKLITLPLILIFMLGCNGNQKNQTIRGKTLVKTGSNTVTAAFLTKNIPPEIIQQGEQASSKLISILKTKLKSAIQQDGIKEAVRFCSDSAQQLTNELNVQLQGKLSIKRISLNYRNPLNKPDPFEERALHLMQKSVAGNGTPPDYLIQRIQSGKTVKYRYYQPLTVGTACLACHGNEKKIKPDILSFIRKRYPNGNATGYQKGDLRGAIRVEMMIQNQIQTQ